LTGTAIAGGGKPAGTQPFRHCLIVQGSWDDPIMLPDAEALIRRSGAAAPCSRRAATAPARDSVRRCGTADWAAPCPGSGASPPRPPSRRRAVDRAGTRAKAE